MARMSGRSSSWGAYLDSTLDRVGDSAIFGGLVLYYAGQGQQLFMAGLALACLILGSVVSYAKARAEGLGMTANVGIAERADRLVAVLAATGLVGSRPARDPAHRRARPARRRQPGHRGPADARRAPPGPRRGVSALAERVSLAAYRAGWYRRCAGCPPAWPTARSTSSPTSPWRRGGKGVQRLRSNYARVRPELEPAALDALVRDGHALLPALLVRRLPAARRGRWTSWSGRSAPRATARCASSSATGRGAIMFLGHLGNWDTRRRLVDHPAGTGHDRRRAAAPRGAVRRVPRLPRVARHADHPADRRQRRLPRAAVGAARRRVRAAARRPRPHPGRRRGRPAAASRPGWRWGRPRSPCPPARRCTRRRSSTSRPRACPAAGGTGSSSASTTGCRCPRAAPPARRCSR